MQNGKVAYCFVMFCLGMSVVDGLSKTVSVNAVAEIETVVGAFEPLVRSICLKLQRDGLVAEFLKVGVQDAVTGWQGVEYKFVNWRYDKLMHQIDMNLALGIEWEEVVAVHVSVSGLVSSASVAYLGAADLLGSER